jgi:hypothetical protein
MAGYWQAISWSFVWCSGREDEGPSTTLMINRIEYLAVNPVAKKNNVIIIKLVGENRANSKIRSFE